MCGQNPTSDAKSSWRLSKLLLAAGSLCALSVGTPVFAQGTVVLEEITVTAQKREEALQDVPISVATMSGDRYEVLFSGSEDILALSGRVPGLYAESSNGRAAPRFYLRGLGNIDFDLAASQPVSIIMDEVVMENVVLKSFPLFDMQQVEVIRGPQGTLFGRNTTAGIIKFNTVRPSQELSGYAKGSWGTFDTTNLEGAVGGPLSDTLAARVSVLKRDRDNWITNAHTGNKSLGNYDETAGRVQLEWAPTDRFSALLSWQRRDLDGTSSIFRANVFTTGSNSLNRNYDRETVYYDGGNNDNPQAYNSTGTTLTLQWDFDEVSATSITSYQEATGFSRGDIDGGVVNIGTTPTPPSGITFADVNVLCPFPCLPARTWPGPIFTPSVTQDGADTDQLTQEFRLASATDGPLSWQLGFFYFDSELVVTTESFASFGFVDRQDTQIEQLNKTWAVFGQVSYDVTDRLTLAAGLRQTVDEKDFRVIQFGQLWLDLGIPTFIAAPISVEDDQLSYEVSANIAASDNASFYGRYANGFRAQTIQGRDVAFLETPSVAKPETIDSFEIGYKADLANNR
ncbi:MAG: TonB-dependent receptor, partial [Woeseiaceae bacterium]|nr:TonB-dependent receptor [Woeseiaceae bacterium]